MTNRLLPATLLLAITGLLAGCGKSSVNAPGALTPRPSMDQAAVSSVLATQPEVIDDAQFDGTDAASMASTAPAANLSAIQPLRFWRIITRVDRRFEFAFADSDSTGRPTTAIVTVHKLFSGRFNILTGVPGSDSMPMDSTLRVVRKPLSDHWVRRVMLKRLPGSDDWRVVATSGVEVTSNGAATKIVSLRVQGAGLDTTVTEPLAFFRLHRILALQPGTPVTLTVTTLRDDDIVVLCRFGHRFRFHNNGDDTYTGVWQVPDLHGNGDPGPGPGRPPIFHVGVNALSNGTLFDDAAPYDSKAWILPILLKPDQVADALP
jgi:hypothetical protein